MSNFLLAAADGGAFSFIGGLATVGEGGAFSLVGDFGALPHWLMNDKTATHALGQTSTSAARGST